MAVFLFILVSLIAACSLLAVLPPPASRPLGWITFFLTTLPSEQPYLFSYVVLAAAIGAVVTGGWAAITWATLIAAGAALVLLTVIAWRGRQARPVLERAFDEALGPNWRRQLPAALGEKSRRRLPYARLLAFPFPTLPPEVELVKDVPYGDGGRAHLLDVYLHRSRPPGAPVLIYWHGGAFRNGDKRREGRALLHHLASQGWVCISANYRLRREADYPANQIDAKRAIAWVRDHAHEYGADPGAIFVAGGSAGAHMASICALSQNDPRFQPGFEEAETSVSGAISLYGYYGPYDWQNVASWEPLDDSLPDAPLPTAPVELSARHAPPFLVVNGTHDGIVPAWTAHEFVARLRRGSKNPVIHAELPGARHAFDVVHSVRTEAVIDAVELFGAWCLSGRQRAPAATVTSPSPGTRTPSKTSTEAPSTRTS